MRTAARMLLVAALASLPSSAWALGFELGESKEELKLDYEVEVNDHKTGRVTIIVTIADAGRMGPLTSVDLVIPGSDGTNRPDLSVPLAVREKDGTQRVEAYLLKDWAERAEIHLKTNTLDGKQEPLTWYYHRIPIAKQMQIEAKPKPKK